MNFQQLSRLPIISRAVLCSQRNLVVAVEANSMKKGMYFVEKGKYFEILENTVVKQGRQATCAGIEYMDLESQKSGYNKFAASAKIMKVEPERIPCTVQYVDKDSGNLIVNDEDFDEINIPLKLLAGAEQYLESGTQITLVRDGETMFKVMFPPTILSMIKNGK